MAAQQIDPRLCNRPAVPDFGNHGSAAADQPSVIHEVKYGEADPSVAGSYNAKQQQRPGGPGAWRPPAAEGESRDPPRATIGDVLEQVGMFSAQETMDEKDARAIQSAEALATGRASGVRGGPASEARSAVDKAASNNDKPTFAEVLHDVKTRMASDKVVTDEDAQRVVEAETRADPRGEIQPGHVAASMSEAATYNKSLE